MFEFEVEINLKPDVKIFYPKNIIQPNLYKSRLIKRLLRKPLS
jgi:hypothetical protein